jgi:hypothetical protein
MPQIVRFVLIAALAAGVTSTLIRRGPDYTRRQGFYYVCDWTVQPDGSIAFGCAGGGQ